MHRHTQVFQQVSSEEHFDLSRLSLADEPFRRQPRPTPAVIAQGAEEEKHQYAIFTRMQKIDGQQAVRKIDKTKLGRQHEALGSHPPLTLEEEVESDEAGSTTQISSRSTRTYSE